MLSEASPKASASMIWGGAYTSAHREDAQTDRMPRFQERRSPGRPSRDVPESGSRTGSLRRPIPLRASRATIVTRSEQLRIVQIDVHVMVMPRQGTREISRAVVIPTARANVRRHLIPHCEWVRLTGRVALVIDVNELARVLNRARRDDI